MTIIDFIYSFQSKTAFIVLWEKNKFGPVLANFTFDIIITSEYFPSSKILNLVTLDLILCKNDPEGMPKCLTKMPFRPKSLQWRICPPCPIRANLKLLMVYNFRKKIIMF